MNVKRFIGRNSREAMQKVRLAFGDNAVVLSTKPCSEGIEIVAMPPESIDAIERFGDDSRAMASPAPAAAAPQPQRPAPAPAPEHWRAAQEPSAPVAAPAASRGGLLARLRAAVPSVGPAATPPAAPLSRFPDPVDGQVQDDVGTLAMSTLSFQDYVRERMLKKRETELREQAARPVPVSPAAIEQRLSQREAAEAREAHDADDLPTYPKMMATGAALQAQREAAAQAAAPRASRRERPVEPELNLGDAPDSLMDAFAEAPVRAAAPAPRAARAPREPAVAAAPSDEQHAMMNEIRAMKGMIEERFGTLAFMEKLQKSPRQAQLITRLLDCGFSPALIRKLADGLPEDTADELAWSASVLQRNLLTGEDDPALEDQGGVFALVGSTGVGKTTSTAKLAAAFATRHGAGNLGLITLDAYRLGAHEQLRAYGRILGVPVHTAHDRVALEDLLDLLSAKKMVLIDTAGLAQRDTRTRELLEMLQHRAIKRLLVVNAAQQGETIEDVLSAYKATQAKGIVLSKMDEAVKLGPALDALIRHRVKVVAVANGQRVPEDWHRLTAQALIQRAMRTTGSQAWRMDVNDVNLLFAAPQAAPAAPRGRSTRNTDV
ncbi:flagellar biosynthesis protein FlhF [Sphaerotilus hippei]|uniref:Flagellar biosynthesis protein FlhF n=1 Tax=Sphaerotilus hippei TaxID=744406 RepID=A0A318H0S5_9BURK|nr:flagellar biosynthesis protein FlhF [Sphaerotilus hippei]PXW96188.1 flagellar biosynthesis protein FlhF [Sphaerotilus hippei]